MTRMDPAAKQGCVLHPSVCLSQYRIRTWGLPVLSSKSASTRYAKQRGHKDFQTIFSSKEIPAQSTVRLGMLSQFRWVPRLRRCLRFRGCKPTRPLAIQRKVVSNVLQILLSSCFLSGVWQVLLIACIFLDLLCYSPRNQSAPSTPIGP